MRPVSSSDSFLFMALDPTLLDVARARLIAMHAQARAGHLGGNLSCLDAMMVLHHEILGEEDRFVLSKGHAAGAYYVTLSTRGVIPEEELASFHGDASRLGGHPLPRGDLPIAFASGSLGHGLGFAAGAALSKKLRGEDGFVFCLTSDGEWQSGATLEAYIFALHNKLSKLVILVDQNGLQGFGTTDDVASMGDLQTKLSGFGGVIETCDGHDPASLAQALRKEEGAGPRLILMRTIKGRGVPDFEGELKSHYLPPTPAQADAALAKLAGASYA